MKKLLFSIFILLFFLLVSQKAFALECKPGFTYNDQKELEQIKNLCEQKLASLGNQRNTLLSEIQYMDTQVYLTGLKIQETETKIDITQDEINSLSTKIEGLDESLNLLSKSLIKRIVSGYKQHSLSTLSLLLDSNGATDFLLRYKYLKTAQENNQKLLIQVQSTKTNFEEQKKMREEKKIELASLSTLLTNQKADLINQQAAKQRFLVATQNDEVVYQQLLEKARQELAGFSAFTQSAGGGCTTFSNGNNGWYYTQRDPQWCGMTLPGSSSSVLLAGCAVTSVAMVCRSYGQGITPASITSDSNNFIYGDLWNWAFGCSGKTTNWLSNPSKDEVKSYAASGVPVILRLYAPSVSGLHFIVAFGWDDGKNDLKIHDPYYGPDVYFNDNYSWSQVTRGIVIR